MQKRILVIEDDCIASKLYLAFLNKSGFATKAVTNAEDAEKVLEDDKINIILTDIKLPGIDGIEFTKKIKKKCNIDVIVITGYSSEYTYEDAINSGASDLLFKPVKLNELLLRIGSIYNKKAKL